MQELQATQLEVDHTNNSLHIQSAEGNLRHKDLQMGA